MTDPLRCSFFCFVLVERRENTDGGAPTTPIHCQDGHCAPSVSPLGLVLSKIQATSFMLTGGYCTFR